MKRYILICTSLLAAATAKAQTPVPDNSFGINGRVIAPVEGTAHAIARQPDGKLITAGNSYAAANYHFQLFRYNNDGSPDNAFGTGGMVTTEISFLSEARAVIIQPDGKILVGGIYHTGDFVDIHHVVLARYNANGTLDNTFGINGIAMPEPAMSDELNDMALQPDGKIVIGGAIYDEISSGPRKFMMARFKSDGTLDNGFGTGGLVTTYLPSSSWIMDISLRPDGKIIAAGNAAQYESSVPDFMSFALARYTSQGTLDSTFGVHGIVTTNVVSAAPDFLQSAVLQADGKILTAGSHGGNHYMVRYNPDGSLDNGFGTGGKAVRESAPGVVHLLLRSNGKIATTCTVAQNDGAADFMLHGYKANGSIDSAFGTNGLILTSFETAIPEGSDDYSECLLIQPDGKIVVAGSASGKVGLVRYTSDGATGVQDPERNTLEVQVYPNPLENVLNLNWYGSARAINTEVRLFNIAGQQVFSTSVMMKEGNNTVKIPNLASGNYILSITADDGKSLFRKITKK